MKTKDGKIETKIERTGHHRQDSTVNDLFSNDAVIHIKSSMDLKDILEGGPNKSCNLSNSSAFISNNLQDIPEDYGLIKGRRNHLFVIEFVADWCGLCRAVAPQVDVSFS